MAIVELLDHYSQEPLAQAQPLTDDARQRLIPGLRQMPTTRAFLSRDTSRQPIGLALCFVGFSSFRARPLINIHDLIVLHSHRRRGVGSRLMQAVVNYARQHDCCSVTLEVRRDNPARAWYRQLGFQPLCEPLSEASMLFGKLLLD